MNNKNQIQIKIVPKNQKTEKTLSSIKEQVRTRLQYILDQLSEFDTDLVWKNSRVNVEHNILRDLKAIELLIKQQKINELQIPLFL